MYYALKPFLFTFLLLSLTPVIVRANETVLVDYEGVTSSSFLGPFGASLIEFEADPTQVFDVVVDPENTNNNVGKFDNYHVEDQTEGNNVIRSWGVISILNFDSVKNVKDYKNLEFSFYSEGDDPIRTMSIQLRFESPDDRNSWTLKQSYQPSLSEAHNKWKTFSIALNEAFFNKESSVESDIFDLEKLTGVSVLILNNDSMDINNEKPVYIDNIKATTEGPVVSSYLKVNRSSVDFGNLTASASNFRFSSDIIELDYLASNTSNWEIRAYTSNPADTLGLVQINEDGSPILNEEGVPTNKILLKINPGGTDNEDDDSNWYGENASFSFVGNISPNATAENSTYARVVFPFNNEGEPINPSAGVFPVKLAIDIAGVVAGKYSTTVTFELHIAD